MEFHLGDLLNFWPIALGLGLMLLPVRWRWWGAAIVAILLAAATLGLGAKEWFGLDSAWMNPYTVRIEAFICITAIMAVSLNLINGITGLFSIGHAGFMVVGAYTAGIMTSLLFRLTGETGLGLALPAFLLSLLAGGLAAAALGFLVGLPTLRLRGDYLAGLAPAGVLCELVNDDGTVQRLPELKEFKQKFGLRMISIAQLIEHRIKRDRLVEFLLHQAVSDGVRRFRAARLPQRARRTAASRA